jgi:hypothetical protein
MARRFEAGALPNLGVPVRPERSAKPIFAPAYLESLNPSHVSTFSHSTPKWPMMEAIADDLPDNDVNGDISSSRDQDAKAEQRRQQNRRNAQAWSKWPQSLCTRDRLCFSYLMVYRASITDEKRCRTIGPRADHRLTLVKLNIFRAFVRNITALGYTRE